MSDSLLLAKRHYEEAKKMLIAKNLIFFMEHIGYALAYVGDNTALLADITYLKANALYQHRKDREALQSVIQAKEYNEGEKLFELNNNEGILNVRLGERDKGIKIFKKLLDEADGIDQLSRVYNNLIWAYLALYRSSKNDLLLPKIKNFLEEISPIIHRLPERRKMAFYNNYGVYYFYKKEYAESIRLTKEATRYCIEEELPLIYNNIVDIYLEWNQDDCSNFIKEYTTKAEIIALMYDNYREVGRSYYLKAMETLRENDREAALDNLYKALEFFRKADDNSSAINCLTKINEILNDLKEIHL